MKLNKKSIIIKLLIFILLLIIATTISIVWTRGKEQNIVLKMKDGLENPEILEFYKQDIIDVETVTKGTIRIKYYDIDLNDDGLKDKIVYIASPLHSGSYGDSFNILINNGESYDRILYWTIWLCDQYYDEDGEEVIEVGELYVLPEKTNGFHNIEIFDLIFRNRSILTYVDGEYQMEIIERGNSE